MTGNYGFDGEQQDAIQVAIGCMQAQKNLMKAQATFLHTNVKSDKEGKLENGLFLKRNERDLESTEVFIQSIEHSIEELQRMLGVTGVTETSKPMYADNEG